MKNITVLIIISVLISACSTINNTTQPSLGNKTIYRLSEEEALKIAELSMLSVLTDERLIMINKPYKGYFAIFRFLLDTYTQQIFVVPVTATSLKGEKVAGFYFEVSGSGTSFVQGRAKNIKIFNKLQQLLEDTGTGILVTRYVPITYDKLQEYRDNK